MTPDRLLALAADLRSGRQPDPSAAAELADAVEAWARGEDLGAALGLRSTGPGKRHAVTAHRLSVRDAHVRRAYQLLTEPPGHRRCLRLRDEIVRFHSRLWPSWKHENEPPARASAIGRALFDAERAASIPESLTRIRSIVVNE